jgi:DUF2934 family protein
MWLEIAAEWDRMAEKADAVERGQLGQQLGAAPVQAEGQGASDIEDEVRCRAYELWEQYGRPEGGDEEFWLKGEREIYEQNRSRPHDSGALTICLRFESRRKSPARQTGGVSCSDCDAKAGKVPSRAA